MGRVVQAWAVQKLARCVTKVWSAGQELSVQEIPGCQASSRRYGVLGLPDGPGLGWKYRDAKGLQQALQALGVAHHGWRYQQAVAMVIKDLCEAGQGQSEGRLGMWGCMVTVRKGHESHGFDISISDSAGILDETDRKMEALTECFLWLRSQKRKRSSKQSPPGNPKPEPLGGI